MSVGTPQGSMPARAGYRLGEAWGGKIVVTFSMVGTGGRRLSEWHRVVLPVLRSKFGDARVMQKGDKIVVKR